jgi:hypothetical protein
MQSVWSFLGYPSVPSITTTAVTDMHGSVGSVAYQHPLAMMDSSDLPAYLKRKKGGVSWLWHPSLCNEDCDFIVIGSPRAPRASTRPVSMRMQRWLAQRAQRAERATAQKQQHELSKHQPLSISDVMDVAHAGRSDKPDATTVGDILMQKNLYKTTMRNRRNSSKTSVAQDLPVTWREGLLEEMASKPSVKASVTQDLPFTWREGVLEEMARKPSVKASISQDRPFTWREGVLEELARKASVKASVTQDLPFTWREGVLEEMARKPSVKASISQDRPVTCYDTSFVHKDTTTNTKSDTVVWTDGTEDLDQWPLCGSDQCKLGGVASRRVLLPPLRKSYASALQP